MGVTRVALTGVNGFIGNQVLERFLKLLPEEWQLPKGHRFEIFGADLLESQTRFTARRFAGSSRYHFLSHTELLSKMESGELRCELVVHNGACSSTTERDPEVFERLNTGYSKRLWNICSEAQIPLIYASSASVYGNGERGFDDAPDKLDELSALNLYARSKLDFDRYAFSADLEPSAWVGLRYFNVYGPFEAHKGAQASMAFHGFHQIVKDGKMRLFRGGGSEYADGEQLRDFVWVGDVVDITMEWARRMMIPAQLNDLREQLKKYSGRRGCFANVGTGQARTWNELAHALFAALQKEALIEYIDMPPGLVKQYQNFTEAKHTTAPALGLDHTWTRLEDGVQEYVRKILLRNIG